MSCFFFLLLSLYESIWKDLEFWRNCLCVLFSYFLQKKWTHLDTWNRKDTKTKQGDNNVTFMHLCVITRMTQTSHTNETLFFGYYLFLLLLLSTTHTTLKKKNHSSLRSHHTTNSDRHNKQQQQTTTTTAVASYDNLISAAAYI